MKPIDVLSVYWGTDCKGVIELIKSFGKALENGVVLSKYEAEKHGLGQVVTCDLELPTMSKVYIDKRGNIIRNIDLSIKEIQDAIKVGACYTVQIPGNGRKKIAATLYSGDKVHDIIEKAYIDTQEALNKFGILAEVMYGHKIEFNDIADMKWSDIENNVELIDTILSINRSYAISVKALDVFTRGIDAAAAEDIIIAMNANYVNSLFE